MNVTMSIDSSDGATRVSIKGGDGAGAVFLYRSGFLIANPVKDLFGPASGGCENLAELFENCAVIIRNELIASGQLKQDAMPVDGGTVRAQLAQLDITAVFVPFGDLAARAALAGPLDTDPAEGGVLPTMESLTTQQLRRLTLELGRDIMGNDRDRLAQFGRMAQGGFSLGDPQPGDIHRWIAKGGRKSRQ